MRATLISLFLILSAELPALAISGRNALVEISTDSSDVLAITPVDCDFHLLVTNTTTKVNISFTAIYPWSLAAPKTGRAIATTANPITYTVQDSEPDDIRNKEATRSGRVILFKPSFRVVPSQPSGMQEVVSDAYGTTLLKAMPNTSGDLTDNFPATVHIDIIGEVPSLRRHTVSMQVSPNAPPGKTLLHHPSVSPYAVSVAATPLNRVWETSNIFWFGIKDDPGGCCYSARYKYSFTLCVDGIICAKREYDVGWPSCAPSVIARAIKGIHSIDVKQIDSEPYKGQWKATCVLPSFTKECTVSGGPFRCQYGAEIEKEEQFHCQQFKATVDFDHGGNPDLFTTRGIAYYAEENSVHGLGRTSDVSVAGDKLIVTAQSRDDAVSVAQQIVAESIEDERTTSWSAVNNRRIWAEYHAKQHAGYNAAWKFHCTYGDGNDQLPPVPSMHPAYQQH